MKKLVLLVSLTTALSGFMVSAQSHRPAPPVAIAQDRLARIDRALGWADKEAGRRMTTDTIFRIASQTKAITSVAILSLMEEGKIGLNDPAGRYIPGFANTTVAVQNGSEPAAFVPAKRQITIRDLLTHTAGISYGTNPSVASSNAWPGCRSTSSSARGLRLPSA